MSEVSSRTDSVTPQTLKHIIGQSNVVTALEVMVASYFNDRMAGRKGSMEHLLFAGPSGTGKTMTAKVLGFTLAAPRVIELSGEALGGDIQQNLLDLNNDDVLFIDEIQAISPFVSAVLLRALSERKLCLGSNPNAKAKMVDLPNFLCLAATTDQWALPPALSQRFVTLRFSHYDQGDICKILAQRLPALGWRVEDGVIAMIAARSKGTPRIALQLLQSVYHQTRSLNEDVLTKQHVVETMHLLRVDDIGLDALEQTVLRTLADHDGGPVRLNVIASRVGAPVRTISNVIETYLVKENLIEKRADGRVLTSKGWEHLRQSPQSSGA